MKRVLILTLGLALLVGLSACGKDIENEILDLMQWRIDEIKKFDKKVAKVTRLDEYQKITAAVEAMEGEYDERYDELIDQAVEDEAKMKEDGNEGSRVYFSSDEFKAQEKKLRLEFFEAKQDFLEQSIAVLKIMVGEE